MRRAVMAMLNDPEWSKWNNCEIARRCGVSDKTVGSLRSESILASGEDSPRLAIRNGTTYEYKTKPKSSEPKAKTPKR